jgi:hypothetical protein
MGLTCYLIGEAADDDFDAPLDLEEAGGAKLTAIGPTRFADFEARLEEDFEFDLRRDLLRAVDAFWAIDLDWDQQPNWLVHETGARDDKEASTRTPPRG